MSRVPHPDGWIPIGVHCDACGIEECQPDMVNGYMSVVSEGNWAIAPDDWQGPEEDVCADCVTPAHLGAGWTRN